MNNQQPYEETYSNTNTWPEPRHNRRDGAWVGGAFLILLGAYFLLQNMGIVELDNWWALFILLPAVGAFSSAWTQYQDAGDRLNRAARGSLLAGLFFMSLSVIFLFSLNGAFIFPLALIMVGLGILLNAILPE